MERTKEMLEARVRETPLGNRLKECQKRIGNMCAELRGPKMSIPVEYYDDDFYICTTLADAQATVEALQRERDEWRSNAVAQEARANNLERDCKDLLSDIDGERAKVGDLLKKIAYWEKRHRTYRELAEENMNCKQAALDALKDAYDELERQHADLRSAFNAEREKVKFGSCEVCWNLAWVLCRDDEPNAVPMKCANGTTYWRCDYCWYKQQLATLQAQLRQVEGELAAMKGATNASS